MPTYKYRGWDINRKIVKGTILGPDPVTVNERIRNLNVTPISIEEKEEQRDLFTPKKRFRDQELVNFCGHMALMIRSGVNIMLSLEILEQQSTNKEIKKVYGKILETVRKGESLSTSMEATEDFPQLVVDMVKVGESTGELDNILLNMEEYYQREIAIRNKVKTATVYPKILVGATVATILFFVYFVVPSFADLFSDMESLPMPTKILLAMTNFFQSNTLLLLGVTLVVAILLIILWRNQRFVLFKDNLILHLPVAGIFSKQVIISRMARSLGVFLKSGVPVLEALDSTKNILRNRHLEKGFDKAIKRIINGQTMSDAFQEEQLFDPMVYGLMRVGQETGQLDEMLYKLAAIYDREVEFSLNKLVAKIEPMMIIIIGGVVGFIVIAIAVPILNMSQGIG
ncbi:type II secretion system F family protein [Proteiniclasticum sp. SCR006]|uniref:Type II secretion system F family protein n=1 Tax=Proteiniclasticum aestuarii TaxID=2817862 RepID=A0A939H821_9CLOT|nr:type II secretion system F family protein [Proteiniclasticum aestuarii]MBO1266027.1 type II secretion system F family protein [Proteiniclasticum aestuarii]